MYIYLIIYEHFDRFKQGKCITLNSKKEKFTACIGIQEGIFMRK